MFLYNLSKILLINYPKMFLEKYEKKLLIHLSRTFYIRKKTPIRFLILFLL